MDLIRNEVMQIKKHKDVASQLPTNSSFSTASPWQSSSTPVFDDAMITQVLDKLTGQQSSLQIIPIVGMGGIGKTTFATNIYTKPLIEQHFQIRAWVTISQEYSTRNLLQVLYKEVKGITDGLSDDEIGLKLYQHLWGRRYVIVMDDIWSVDAWDKVKSFFPDNNDGSRIMMTTRLINLASELSGCHVFQIQFLDEDNSWDLFCKVVFGKLGCPIELEDIGKEIARKCGGLPLSIAVIGGFLRKSNMTLEYWIDTLKDLNSLINSDNDEYALRLLRTSYKELLMHLKPCFLYIGIFLEDTEIKVSVLIKLWVAEGILRPIDDKSLEEVGKEYLKELIDRNLILISKLRLDGEVKLCKIHDLLRDICLREAQKQKFFCLLRQQKHHTPQDINMERRICIHFEKTGDKYSPEFLHAVETASLTRSLLFNPDWDEYSPSLPFRLLRVYSQVDKFNRIYTRSSNAIFEQANMRYLSLLFDAMYAAAGAAPRLLSLFSLLWNPQTLKVYGLDSDSPEIPIIASKIWEMPLLRHVKFYDFVLSDPPNGEHNYVLENLQTLSGIMNLKFSEEVVRRIPNIKKLELTYDIKFSAGIREELPDFCFYNLGRVQKLESLDLLILNRARDCGYDGMNLVSFPHSLKKLSLCGTMLNWEECTEKIASLPLLQHLILSVDACVGPRWETNEGKFCSLRVLEMRHCESLKYWETENAHFPCLEHLSLGYLPELEEIPSSIGDIPTLKSIRLEYCSTSASDSAKVIKEEQQENENEDLQVEIEEYSDDEVEEDSSKEVEEDSEEVVSDV